MCCVCASNFTEEEGTVWRKKREKKFFTCTRKSNFLLLINCSFEKVFKETRTNATLTTTLIKKEKKTERDDDDVFLLLLKRGGGKERRKGVRR